MELGGNAQNALIMTYAAVAITVTSTIYATPFLGSLLQEWNGMLLNNHIQLSTQRVLLISWKADEIYL